MSESHEREDSLGGEDLIEDSCGCSGHSGRSGSSGHNSNSGSERNIERAGGHDAVHVDSLRSLSLSLSPSHKHSHSHSLSFNLARTSLREGRSAVASKVALSVALSVALRAAGAVVTLGARRLWLHGG